MKKFLSIFIAVAMVMSFAMAFSSAPQAMAAPTASSNLQVNIVYPTNGYSVPSIGDTFYVDAAIANKGVDPFNGTATLTIDGNATILDGASKDVSLGDHGVQDVWWKVKCTGPGNVKLTVTAGSDSDSVTIKQPGQSVEKKLHVTWVETPCGEPFNGEVPEGTYFTVKAKVHSDFDYAENVALTIHFTGNLQLLSAQTVNVGNVYSERDEEVAWNFQCTGQGDASVSVSATADNLSTDAIELPDECDFHQGPKGPGPAPTPGEWTINIKAPKKVCTDCGENMFTISASATNGTGTAVKDVYAEIKIDQPLLASLEDLNTQRQVPTVNGDVYNAQWGITCTGKGPTTFEITFYKDGNPTLGSGTPVVSGTVTVNQNNYLVTVDDVYADQSVDTDFITRDQKTGVYETEVCDTFHVKTTFKNCTCYPIDSVSARIVRENPNTVELDPNGIIRVEEWEVNKATGQPTFKQAYEKPASAVIDNNYILPLNTNCACCYFVVYWPFKCTGSDYPNTNTITFQAIKDNDINNPLDTDSFKLQQLESPKLQAGIDIFSGHWSDGSLGTTEISGVAVPTDVYCNPIDDTNGMSNFTVVIPVANTGDVTAENVSVDVYMKGDYNTSVTLVDPTDPTSTSTVNFTNNEATISGLTIPGHSTYKIILETNCTGDEDLTIGVTKITGDDTLTGEAIPEKDNCGNPNFYLPKDKTLMQIPLYFEIVEPADGSSVYASTNYTVKIKIHNCSQDKNNVIEGLQATLSIKGNAELNADTGETATHSLGDLAPGNWAETGWNVHCTGEGAASFTVTLTASKPQINLSQSVSVLQKPVGELNVKILSPTEGDCYATGQQFAVSAEVTYHAYLKGVAAENVKIKLTLPQGSAFVVDDPNTSPAEIDLGEIPDGYDHIFTWTLQTLSPTCSEELAPTVNVSASGSNVSDDSSSQYFDVYKAAKLIVSDLQLTDMSGAPITDVEKGTDFIVKGFIKNIGWADATDVNLTLTGSNNIAPQPGHTFTLNAGTVPALRPETTDDLDNYQGIPFEFYVQCEDAGKTTITITPSGKDEYGFSWAWANRLDLGVEWHTAGEFMQFVWGVEQGYIPDEFALKPIPDFCIAPAGTTFKQVIPAGPTLTISSPENGLVTNNPDVTVTFSATGGTEPYTFAAMLDGSGAVGGNWISPIPAGSYTFHNLSDGAHTLYIKVTDANGLYYIGYVNVVIDQTPPPAPSANPVGGTYSAAQTVTLSDAEAGVSIYYTTDGTIPTTSSTLYTAPISIGEGMTTLKAIAVDAAGNVSDVMTEIYNVVIPPSQVSVTLNLADGWSLISVPFETSTSNLGSNVDQVYEWNGTVWAPVTTLEPGVGYLIHHSGTESLTLSGAPTASPVTIDATGTWQLIGDPFEVAIPWSSIGGVQISQAYYWDGSVWQPVNLATDSMQPGVGYLILTSDVGSLTFQRP